MTKREFNQFCRELQDIISDYLNDDAWEVVSKWFEDDRGEIIIEYNYNSIDWDVVDEDWESDCDDDLCELCDEWGGSWDWNGQQISWGFNL